MQTKQHGDQVSTIKVTTDVSGFQEPALQCVQLIRDTGAANMAGCIDVVACV